MNAHNKRTPKKAAKALPKAFQVDKVVLLDTFIKKNALTDFDATRPLWIVVANLALKEGDTWIMGFSNRDDAIRYAQGCSNGNGDHRVLQVTEQVLVLGTINDL